MGKKGRNNERNIIGIKAEPLAGLLGAYKYSKDDLSTVAFILNRDLIENSGVSLPDIEWSQSISDTDQQLYRRYNLTSEEIDYVEKTIKLME